MDLRAPKKVITEAWVEIYAKVSWGSRESPQAEAKDLAQRVANVIADHSALKDLGVQVRTVTEDQCPECSKPYETGSKGSEYEGYCAWCGCDLRVPEEAHEPH